MDSLHAALPTWTYAHHALPGYWELDTAVLEGLTGSPKKKEFMIRCQMVDRQRFATMDPSEDGPLSRLDLGTCIQKKSAR